MYPAGWHDLVEELERHLLYLCPDYETVAITKENGALRYVARFVPQNGMHIDDITVASQIFDRLIDETQRRSVHHCEVCGEPATLRRKKIDEDIVLCDTHGLPHPNRLALAAVNNPHLGGEFIAQLNNDMLDLMTHDR